MRNLSIVDKLWPVGFCLALFSAVLSRPVFAQDSLNALNGKIVHVYNPFILFSPSVPSFDVNYGPTPMTQEGTTNWYTYTITGLAQYGNDNFDFRNAPGNTVWGKNGFGTNSTFSIADFQGASEIWIITDPSGPDSAAPLILTHAPELVHILNPWPLDGPEIVINGKTDSMLLDQGHCNWFSQYILTSDTVGAYFISVSSPDSTWGKAGYGDKSPIDLTAAFAKYGNELWINSENGTITAAFPNIEGICSYLMAATVHDMSAHYNPDYGPGSVGNGGNGPTLGMVENQLGADQKPVPTATTLAQSHFQTWFNSDSTIPMPYKGYQTCVDLPMGKAGNGEWQYDSYNNSNHSFFPIDDFNKLDANDTGACYDSRSGGGWPPADSLAHNFGFCMETHATFIYKPGQVFQFRGDDDVWVFINNKLALDLGGRHVDLPGSIDLDQQGLTPGQKYNWDFFYCERQKCASSLLIKTSIYFNQLHELDVKPGVLQPDGSILYTVFKRNGGTGSCESSADSLVTESAPASLVYTLYPVNSSTAIQNLTDSVTFGGIRISTPNIYVDTSKIRGLAPGTYRIVTYEPTNTKVLAQITFTVSAHNFVELVPAVVDTSIGTLVPVVAENWNGAVVDSAASAYQIVIPPGLLVYHDQAKTTPVANLAILTTKATGFDTLWATGDPNALTDSTYKMNTLGSAKQVTLTFRLPPIILPKVVAAGVYDDNADGIADRISVTFDSSIAADLPKQVSYQWPGAASPVVVTQANLAADLDSGASGNTLTFKGVFTAAVQTSGAGTFKFTYPARGKDSTQSVPIQDRMAPIVLSAELLPGNTMDTLRVVLSEGIATNALQSPMGNLFQFKTALDSAGQFMPPQSLSWGAGDSIALLGYAPGQTPAPIPGDLVRIAPGPGGVADAGGNVAGANARYRAITGTTLSTLETVTLNRGVEIPEALRLAPAILPIRAELTDSARSIETRTGRMGHLIKTDLADYLIHDDFTSVDISNVRLDYDVAYFTNLGAYVNSGSGEIKCTDAIFEGDCTLHRGYVFIGWNYTSKHGERIGTGAYIARIHYQIIVNNTVMPYSRTEIWGIVRED